MVVIRNFDEGPIGGEFLKDCIFLRARKGEKTNVKEKKYNI